MTLKTFPSNPSVLLGYFLKNSIVQNALLVLEATRDKLEVWKFGKDFFYQYLQIGISFEKIKAGAAFTRLFCPLNLIIKLDKSI